MKIGIIGSGLIVPSFIDAVNRFNDRNQEKMEIAALCGRKQSEEKVFSLASDFNIKNVYFDVEQMLLNNEIDTVYVAVSNNVHYEMAKKALLSGKNVLVEKPFTVKACEAQELFEIAKERKLFLFEMAPNRYFPNLLKMKELLKKLGDVKIVQINYSQYSRRYDNFKKGIIESVFDVSKAGGALMDLGIYNIYIVLELFGIPKNHVYYPNVEKGVDTSGVLIMQYDGFMCSLIAAKNCSSPVCIDVQGDEGYFHSSSPSNILDSFDMVLNNGEKEHHELNNKADRMVYEIEAFYDMMKNRDYDLCFDRMRLTVEAVRILEKARNYALNL